MMPSVEDYLKIRRAAGFELENTDYLLRSFARFATQRGETHVRTETAIVWASQALSLAQRDTRLKTVARFARHVYHEDERHELPPSDYFGYHKTRRTPFIYSHTDINRLIQAALQLGSSGALQPQVYATLLALLAATGLRISEALALRFADITPEGLLLRKTKFRKSRLVPLHDTAMDGLERYLRRRRQMPLQDDHLFVTDQGQPLPYWAVHQTFQTLLKEAGLWQASREYRPRLHDFRHSFAVRALEACSPGRANISRHMLGLATYLGHANVLDTYWYLQATPQLLSSVAIAGETFLFGESS